MRPLVLFAPGAGAPSSHRWVQNWKSRLSHIADVETFDYDYMREGRKRPDRLPQLIDAHRSALKYARERHPSAVPILIGKSMGGRVGCHLSLQEKVSGLVCLGYPLCAMGDRTKVRDEVLRALTTPILFVQGTRNDLEGLTEKPACEAASDESRRAARSPRGGGPRSQRRKA